MPPKPTGVDDYLRDGCGRCAKFATPACKVHRWSETLLALRALVQRTELAEQVKWGCPCYTLGDRNVVMLAAYEESCTLSFFRGTELQDPERLLESAGPNSRIARIARFRSADEVRTREQALGRLLVAAIAVEKTGEKARVAPAAEPIPEELARVLASDPTLGDAFARLTAGRRRSHILHVSGAKLEETRVRRARACVKDILAGRGFAER